MKPLKHWNYNSFEISTFGNSYKNDLSKRKNKIYYDEFLKNKECKYTYNELGFRGDSVNKTGFKIMSIGCSFTEGVGVNDNETWPSVFSKLIPNGVNLNFGCGGRSNDYIVRCLLSYYDIIKPDLILIMYTFPHRREIYTENNGVEPFNPSSPFAYMFETEEGKHKQNLLIELQNNNEDFANWYKNHLLIKYFLESKKCNWLWNGSFSTPTEFIEDNRFDGDYSKFIDFALDNNHPGPKHNRNYSIKLFNYLFDNYTEILPKNISRKDFI